MARFTGAIATAVLILAAMPATAAVMYMWTDASGRVQYSDRPPKNFDGPVRRMDIDDTPATPAPVPPKPAAKPETATKAAVPDMATKRRAERERLQHDLDVARDKLAAARKALAEHQEPANDERQMVQRPGRAANAPPMPGYVTPSARSNCHVVEREGKKVTTCPVSIPNDAYYDRIAKLEQAVKEAEEEVANAEGAYRHGVD